MTERKVSTEPSQLLYIEVDGKEFARARLTLSSTVIQLRNILYENYKLPSSTYFVDTKGYGVAREDEQIDTIKQLLHVNDTIQMKTVEIILVKMTPTNTSSLKAQGKEVFNKSGTFIINQLVNILGWLWYLVLKPMIIMTLMCLLLYYSYTKLLCHHVHYLPLVTTFCPVQPSEIFSVPALGKQVENSASLANTLANADVSAPTHCVHVKIALIELRAQIMYSDIDKDVREKLTEHMLELQKLTQIGADQLTTMLASFGGVLDKLQIHTQFLLKDLSKVKDQNIHHGDQLQIGYTEDKVTQILTDSFDEYRLTINAQVDKILFKAEKAHMSLELISNKLETIQNLNYKGRQISQSRLDQLQHGSYWSQLFDEGQISIVKHQRNIQTLDGFNDFIRKASENIDGIIAKLRSFRNDATDLKETTAALDVSRRKSLEREVHIIEAALERLTQSKQTFERKIEQKNREN